MTNTTNIPEDLSSADYIYLVTLPIPGTEHRYPVVVDAYLTWTYCSANRLVTATDVNLDEDSSFLLRDWAPVFDRYCAGKQVDGEGMNIEDYWPMRKDPNDAEAPGILESEWRREQIEEAREYWLCNGWCQLGEEDDEEPPAPPTLVWDVTLTAEQWVDDPDTLLENPGQTRDQLFVMILKDSDFWDNEFEYLCDALTEWMEELDTETHCLWVAEVSGFGWRGSSGTKEFRAEDGASLLRQVLPNTDCTYTITKEDGYLHINNAHHDKPTGGEIYIIRPAPDEDTDA